MSETIQPKTNWSLTDAFALANTLANHGWTRDANADAASSCIYALCRLLKDGGDAAAMREALELAKKAICNHARANHTCASLAWENSTINANCGDILCAHRDLCEAKTAIQKALAAPPRNCDVYSHDEALRVWAAEKENEQNGCFDEWLYATATEQEGENDESK